MGMGGAMGSGGDSTVDGSMPGAAGASGLGGANLPSMQGPGVNVSQLYQMLQSQYGQPGQGSGQTQPGQPSPVNAGAMPGGLPSASFQIPGGGSSPWNASTPGAGSVTDQFNGLSASPGGQMPAGNTMRSAINPNLGFQGNAGARAPQPAGGFQGPNLSAMPPGYQGMSGMGFDTSNMPPNLLAALGAGNTRSAYQPPATTMPVQPRY